MKKRSRVLIAAAMAVALIGCGSKATSPTPAGTEGTVKTAEATKVESAAEETEAPKETVKLRVAHHAGLSGCIIPGIDRVEGNQFFEKEGLEIEWVKFTSGPPEVAAMVSGDIQFGYIGHGAHTLAAENKINVISLNHLGNSEKIMVRKDSGIGKIEDLKGKVIATQLGTSGEVILNLALAGAGMTKEDMDIMNMDMAGAVTAFIAGQVDAIACWDVHATNVIDQVGIDNLNIIASTGQFSDQTAFPASWTATPEYIEKNHDVVVRFIRALNNCYDYRDAHLDESIKSASEFSGTDYETFNKTKNDAENFTSAQLKEMIDDGGLKSIYQLQLDYLIKDGKVKEGNVDTYLRTDLMKEAFGE